MTPVRVRAEIRALTAYPVSGCEDLTKLDAMENPYQWPADMQEEWLDHLRGVPLNRYPDPTASRLKQSLRDNLDIPGEMEILLGNGSDELIQIIQLCTIDRDGFVVAPSPSFVMYEMTARFVGVRFVGVPLAADYSIDEDAMLRAIDDHDPAVVFLAYPNNPTGNLFDRGVMDRIIRRARGLVVVDEAYHAFSETSYVDQIGSHDNLVVMHTLSKLGLAGLRLGYLIGPAAWLKEFDKVRMPYNINVLTQRTVEFALQRMDVFERQASQIISERRRLYAFLKSRAGVTPYPSQANFILFCSDGLPASELFDQLVAQGILVKSFSQAGSGLDRCLRVSVGTAEENDAFMAALDKTLGLND
jgi:histidinol-phosphate aminotransferase